MNAIFASKMYKASNRKKAIRCALSNPINAQLVSQLRSYLDEEYVDETIREPEVEEKPETIENEEVEEVSDDVNEESTGERSSHPHINSAPPSHSDSEMLEQPHNIPSANNPEGIENTQEPEPEGQPESESEDVESATDVDSDETEEVEEPELNLEDIQNLLENDESTFGVNRISERENEVWIYYEDNINLNKVMSNVIEKIEKSEFNQLEFNRLARSSNAIVFQIANKE